MNSLEQFLNTLLADLDDLPVYVVDNTKEYYESYFLDAKEEGLSDFDILDKLGDPASISSQIKLDYYLYQPKQTNQVFKRLYSGVFQKTALSTGKYLLGITIFILAITFYIVQLAFLISGIASIGMTGYLLYSNNFLINDVGVMYLCSGGVAFAVLMLISVIFKALSFWFRKATTQIIRESDSSVKKQKKKRFKPAILLYTLILIASLIFIVTSPIYKDLLYIWISERPASVEVLEYTIDELNVDDIVIESEHVNVFIYYSDVDDIEIRYDNVSYMDFSYHIYEGKLFITESANEEIPFLHDFFARHPGTLELYVILPETMTLNSLEVETVGSPIFIERADYDIGIVTQTSHVDISYIGEYDFNIETRRGSFEFEGETYTDFQESNNNQNMISIEGSSPNIEVEEIE